jgi:hypothetical protein
VLLEAAGAADLVSYWNCISLTQQALISCPHLRGSLSPPAQHATVQAMPCYLTAPACRTPGCAVRAECYCDTDEHCGPGYGCVPGETFPEYLVGDSTGVMPAMMVAGLCICQR